MKRKCCAFLQIGQSMGREWDECSLQSKCNVMEMELSGD